MRRLSYTIMGLTFWSISWGQETSPHGESASQECATCHIAGDWWTMADPMSFDHDTETEFVLNGAHADVDCIGCHTSMDFSEATGECASCHTDIHSATVGNDCARCHNESSWLVDFIPELHEMNGFPLAGAHGGINCADCHMSEVNLRFDRVGNECATCHTDDYFATTEPNHVQVGFGLNCVDCHDALNDDWEGVADINHDFFPLIGGHNIGDCTECHNPNDYSDISADCYSCHQDDYVATTNPNHIQLNFSIDCAECHTVFDWDSEVYNHDQFPLNGAHAVISCDDCHMGVYQNTPSDCFACHSDDYNNSVNPDHRLAGFSTDCTECHNDEAWIPSTFNHNPLFPIENGNHARGQAWNECTECHIEPNNYSIFSCIDCHEHNKNDMDDEHDDVNGYVYSTPACFDCHPRGQE